MDDFVDIEKAPLNPKSQFIIIMVADHIFDFLYEFALKVANKS